MWDSWWAWRTSSRDTEAVSCSYPPLAVEVASQSSPRRTALPSIVQWTGTSAPVTGDDVHAHRRGAGPVLEGQRVSVVHIIVGQRGHRPQVEPQGIESRAEGDGRLVTHE